MKALKLSLVLILAVLSYNCSSAGTSTVQDGGDKKETKKVIMIDKNEDGKTVKYKAEFSNDKLVSLERNGEKVPEKDFDKYSDVIYDEIIDISENDDNDSDDNYEVHKNIIRMKDFPDSTFTVHMHKLNDKLKKIKKIEIKIDGLDGLDSLDIPEFDMKDFHRNMREFHKNFGNNEDFDQLKKDMAQIKQDLEEIKTQLKEMKKK